MRRGDVVIAAQRGDLTGKPRPYVVVQRQTTIADSSTLTVCPITTGLIGSGPIRIAIAADLANGLEEDSEVDVGRVTTVRKQRVRQRVGRLEPAVMSEVDVALRLWLDL